MFFRGSVPALAFLSLGYCSIFFLCSSSCFFMCVEKFFSSVYLGIKVWLQYKFRCAFPRGKQGKAHLDKFSTFFKIGAEFITLILSIIIFWWRRTLVSLQRSSSLTCKKGMLVFNAVFFSLAENLSVGAWFIAFSWGSLYRCM